MIWAFGQELPIWICILIDCMIGFTASVIWDILIAPHQGVLHITEGREGRPDRYLFEFIVEPDILRYRRKVVFKTVKERESQEIQQP